MGKSRGTLESDHDSPTGTTSTSTTITTTSKAMTSISLSYKFLLLISPILRECEWKVPYSWWEDWSFYRASRWKICLAMPSVYYRHS